LNLKGRTEDWTVLARRTVSIVFIIVLGTGYKVLGRYWVLVTSY